MIQRLMSLVIFSRDFSGAFNGKESLGSWTEPGRRPGMGAEGAGRISTNLLLVLLESPLNSQGSGRGIIFLKIWQVRTTR